MKLPVIIFVAMLALLAGIRASAQTTYPKPVTTVPIGTKPATTAPVKKPDIQYLIFPPAEFDHEYNGDLTIMMADTIEELRALCHDGALINPIMIACSQRNAKSCLIIMVRDEVMRQRGYSTGIILRHEIGHCNGWGQDHTGLQPLFVGDTRWAPEHQRIKLPPIWLEEAAAIKAKKASR